MDNISDDRFYSFRQPAWHGIGEVSDVERGAVEAYSRMTPMTITLEPIFNMLEGTPKEISTLRGIYRHPIPTDPQYRLLGTVGNKYRLIDPLRLCELYDENVKQHIETMGVLGKGETLFFSTRLMSYDVRGDQVDSYMVADSPYSGNASINIRVTKIRPVCQNTLIMGKKTAMERYAIRHDDRAEEDLGLWMGGIVDRALGKIKTFQEMFEKMAAKRIKPAEVEPLLASIYPDPTMPNTFHPDPARQEAQLARWEENRQYYARLRETTKLLFEGKGVGQDTEAAAGTAWGLFNAAAERAQYASGLRQNNPNSLWTVIDGYRGDETARAFQYLWDFTQAPSLEDAVPVQKTATKRSRK